MATLEWRDRITLGAGALVLLGALALMIALLIAQLPVGLAGAATATAGAAVLTSQRRATARRN
jgi:hypothetical protein